MTVPTVGAVRSSYPPSIRDVLRGRRFRVQADRLAYAVVQQEEACPLAYSPPADGERIWARVMYLCGVDTMEAPRRVPFTQTRTSNLR